MHPDARCYGNAMRACAAGGNWQLSLALLNTMKKEGVTRTAFNYNIAMQVGGVFCLVSGGAAAPGLLLATWVYAILRFLCGLVC